MTNATHASASDAVPVSREEKSPHQGEKPSPGGELGSGAAGDGTGPREEEEEEEEEPEHAQKDFTQARRQGKARQGMQATLRRKLEL